MKKLFPFYTLGTLVLAMGGFMVTQANKRSTQYNASHAKSMQLTVTSSGHFTTYKGIGARTCYIVTTKNVGITQTFHTLITIPAEIRQLYYK